MNEEIWGYEVGDPVEDDDHIHPLAWSEAISHEHITTEGNMRWSRGEIIFIVMLGIIMMSLVIFSIIRDAPHP